MFYIKKNGVLKKISGRIQSLVASAIGFTPPSGMSATDVQGAIVEVNTGKLKELEVTKTYITNSYVNQTSFGRCYFRTYGRLLYMFLNIQINSTMPTNTANVVIGKITLPSGYLSMWSQSVILPSQENNSYGNLMLGFSPISNTNEYEIVISNYSGKNCYSFYRAIIPVLLSET